MLTIGVKRALLLPAFKRYVLEDRGVSLAVFMTTQLSATELHDGHAAIGAPLDLQLIFSVDAKTGHAIEG